MLRLFARAALSAQAFKETITNLEFLKAADGSRTYGRILPCYCVPVPVAWDSLRAWLTPNGGQRTRQRFGALDTLNPLSEEAKGTLSLAWHQTNGGQRTRRRFGALDRCCGAWAGRYVVDSKGAQTEISELAQQDKVVGVYVVARRRL